MVSTQPSIKLSKQIMMGPERVGSTKDVNGTFEIVHRLDVLINWGTKWYKEWFDNNILEWYRGHQEGMSQS